MTTSVVVEFGGGAELLFNNQRELKLTLSENPPSDASGDKTKWTIRHLIRLLKEKHLQERPELFVEGETVRPGILVLINDADWELSGELDYQIQDKDKITFISTLHGG